MRIVLCPLDDARARDVIDEIFRTEATQRQRRRFGGWNAGIAEGVVEKIDSVGHPTFTVPVTLKVSGAPSGLASTIPSEELERDYLYVRSNRIKRPFEFSFCDRRIDGFLNTLSISTEADHAAVKRAAKEAIASFILRVNNAFELAHTRRQEAHVEEFAGQVRAKAIADLRRQRASGNRPVSARFLEETE